MPIRLRADVKGSTGRTTHYLATVVDDTPVPTKELPIPAWVEISEENEAFFLSYFDADGTFLTDTWHETLEKAKKQANFEFGITADEWREVLARDSS